jgi:hypothetical protein
MQLRELNFDRMSQNKLRPARCAGYRIYRM